jgi:hypothetical protein
MTALGNSGKFDWGALWGDLLKGAGRGLLTYEGSRAAQAALAGLDHFEAAQERRRQQSQHGDRSPDDTLQKLQATLSPEQLAALLRLPLEDQIAWAEENAESQSDRMPRLLGTSNSQGQSGQPMPVHPLNGWHLQSVLPFGSDGRLNLPTYRR